MLRHELENEPRDIAIRFIQCKMTGVEQMDFRTR